MFINTSSWAYVHEQVEFMNGHFTFMNSSWTYVYELFMESSWTIHDILAGIVPLLVRTLNICPTSSPIALHDTQYM